MNDIDVDAVVEDYLVYIRGDAFCVRGAISGREVFEGEDAHAAIQHAVDACGQDGGSVTLSKGTYYLTQPVRLHSNISLYGNGRSTRLAADLDSEFEAAVVCEGVRSVEIARLAVHACGEKRGSGILIDDCGDCKVHDAMCSGFENYGICMRNNSMLCEIDRCSLAGNRAANLFLADLRKGRYGDYIPNLVNGCIAFGGGKGVECKGVIVMNIIGCVVYQTAGIAFHIHSGCNSIVLSGSRSFQISDHAVVVEKSNEICITGNTFCWHVGDGIVVDRCKWGTISGNQVIDSGSYNPGTEEFATRFDSLPEPPPAHTGVVLRDARALHVGGNAIFNWPCVVPMKAGISESDSCMKNAIVGNTITYFNEEPVISQGDGTVVANNATDERCMLLGVKPEKIQSFRTELIDSFIAEIQNAPGSAAVMEYGAMPAQ